MPIRRKFAKLDTVGYGAFHDIGSMIVAHQGTIGPYSMTYAGGQIDTGGTQLTKYTRGTEPFMPGGSVNISGAANDGVTAWFDF